MRVSCGDLNAKTVKPKERNGPERSDGYPYWLNYDMKKEILGGEKLSHNGEDV
jgi:hypothetical protein